MLTEEHIKEGLSRSYVQAVSAIAGVIVDLNRGHDYGIDGSFHEVLAADNQRVESGITLDFQLKATTRILFKEDRVHYSLDARTNNLLARRSQYKHLTQAILIILSLPDQYENWLQLSEQELVLKNCCYWSSISSLTTNIYTATIKIPRSQVFTPDALSGLLNKVAHGLTV